jgi:hypothetical protein
MIVEDYRSYLLLNYVVQGVVLTQEHKAYVVVNTVRSNTPWILVGPTGTVPVELLPIP